MDLIVREIRKNQDRHRVPDTLAIAADEDRSARNVITKTLTPQRLFVLSWALAAIFAGMVGMASVHFAPGKTPRPDAYAGVRLPPSGPVGSTASIGLNGQDVSVQVLDSLNGRMVTSSSQMERGQIETLQRQVVALRRRLAMMSEQNVAYSRRISALEEAIVSTERKDAPLLEQNAPGSAIDMSERSVPVPAIPRKDEQTEQQTIAPVPTKKSEPVNRIEVLPAPETLPRKIQTYRQAQAEIPQATKPHEPVRIVKLPSVQQTDSLIATASIPDDPEPETTDVETDAEDILVRPSSPAGRASGPGKAAIGRTDFGAVVGRYTSKEEAQAAWSEFQTQNAERMQDLTAVTAPSEMASGEIDLLVGPFANAADAAVACLQLLSITETCHPALFVGNRVPLITAGKPETVPASRLDAAF
ncbi:hypothetical protein [Roseibium sp.]|uniref:hypothetical protein n=1 Tax=Roseibium sp. TaxID=1936156 RepID=UPI003A96DCCB